MIESTHSTPRSEARGMLRVDTERRFLPRFKNRGLAPSNVSKNGQKIFSVFALQTLERCIKGYGKYLRRRDDIDGIF